MRRIANFWLVLRQRPMAMLGMVIGVLVFGVLFSQGIEIHKRVIRIEAKTPCLDLTTRQCAEKLLGSLTPKQQAALEHRYRLDVRSQTRKILAARKARQQARGRHGRVDLPRHGRAGGGGSPGSSPGFPRRPGSHAPGSRPVTPSPAPVPAPAPAPSGGSGGGSGGGGSGEPPHPPAVQTPPVHTPPIGPLPPVTVPSVTIPCPQTALTC